MQLEECRAVNNKRDNFNYEVFAGSRLKRLYRLNNCVSYNEDGFRPEVLFSELLNELS